MLGNTNEIAKKLSKEFASHYFKEKYEYKGNDLGSVLSDEGTVFKVWSPIATTICLNLYKDGEPDTKPFAVYEMTPGEQGVWSYQSEERLENIYYTYSVTALGETRETGDIYARACGVNGYRSMVIDLNKTNPKGWEKDSFTYDNNKQPIIYELHIKDFSHDEKSGIPQAHRGKYLAFTHPHSYYNHDETKPTCLAYLKALGITHVHILPMYDFGSIDETVAMNDDFNWGYDPVNYNVPEGSYATDAHQGAIRINEMKQMIKALHDAGIGVIMDVVYNHTYSTDSYFQRTVPYYYYRLDKDGKFANGSGCGNETASERMMFRKYMIDSIMYWAQEYHLDGFRFDLMGLHDTETMNQIRASLNTLPQGENILLYGEPWSAEPPAMDPGFIPANKENLNSLDTQIAIFSDDTRDAIKGSVFLEKKGGYINGEPLQADKIRSAIGAWCDSEEIDNYLPRQIISYISAHDNFTFYDKLVLSMKDIESYEKACPELLQVNKLGAAIIFTCMGGSFMQAGEEFARTKQGIGDSYNSPASINQLNWEWAYNNEDLIDFYKGLIELRKNTPALMKKEGLPKESIQLISQESEHIVSFIIHDQEQMKLFIAYNPEEEERVLDLPEGKWQIRCDGHRFMKENGESMTRKVTIPKKAALILVAE